jgi:soluble cytochrome b562
MKLEKPKKIDFIKLCEELKNEINLIESFIVLKVEEVNKPIETKSKLIIPGNIGTNQNEQEIIDKKLGIQELVKELDIKKQVLYEYELRCLEQENKEASDHDDFTKNFDEVYKKAVEYSQNKDLIPDLKRHLSFVLSIDIARFDTERKITWYLSLKTEIKICENYFNFKNKN